MKIINQLCIMGFTQHHYGLWNTEDELDKVCQEISNRGFYSIRFVGTGYYGSQDNTPTYTKDWVFPWIRKNNKVDFTKLNDNWVDRMHLVFSKMKKYGLKPRLDLFDGCGATSGYDPYQTIYNSNSIIALWDTKLLPYLKKYIKKLIDIAKEYFDINDIIWGTGNELYAYPTVNINGTKILWNPEDCAKWQKEIATYLVSLGVKYNVVVSGHENKRNAVTDLNHKIASNFNYNKVLGLSDIAKKTLLEKRPLTLGEAKKYIGLADFNALSRFLGTSLVEWLQVYLMKWKEGNIEKGWGLKEWTGNLYFAFHEYDDTTDFNEGNLLDRFTTFNGAVVKTKLLNKAEISTDGSAKKCKKHQAGWPYKGFYGMGTDEEILALYKHMISTCESMGCDVIIFDFLENGWIKSKDGVTFYLDWSGYDWLAVEMIMDYFRKKFGKESANRGKYPEQLVDDTEEDEEEKEDEQEEEKVEEFKSIRLFSGFKFKWFPIDIRWDQWKTQWTELGKEYKNIVVDSHYITIPSSIVIWEIVKLIFRIVF